MTTDERVQAFARRRFGPTARVEPLAGDASTRRFFRLFPPGLSPLILMVHPEPFELERLPFFQQGRFLAGIGAAVPRLIASYPKDGILAVEDLGDETLQLHLEHCGDDRRRFLYLQAVQMIGLLQGEGTRCLTHDLPAASTVLDARQLREELSFFTRHYVHHLCGSPLTSSQMDTLEAWFEELADQVGGYPRVLCHRDFHSRNLMVKQDRLYMVDFQDARLGPYTYDLASLIQDSYVRLPADLIDEIVAFHKDICRISEPAQAFRRALDRTCLQRNIKALGTFAAQAELRGNRSYLRYIAPTLGSVRARLEQRSAGEADREVLALFSGALDGASR
ncbi:MAG: aminoglycoside phosphotransferase family protein [Acidobacteriota bacterium]